MEKFSRLWGELSDRRVGDPDNGRRSMTPVSRSWSALTHPVFWAALFVLLLNDRVLKGASLLPPVVTGKLSDFAGLIVAPLVLCALAAGRTPRRRAICFAAVAIVFGGIKLSGPAADALVDALAALGWQWHVAVDPTDLIALAALPVAWRLDVSHPRRAVAGGGALLGMVASLGSGEREPGTWSTPAYVVNATGVAIDLRVRVFNGGLDCTLLDEYGEYAFDPDAFSEGATFFLQAGETLDIRPGSTNVGAGLNEFYAARECHAVLLQAEGMPDRVVAWHSDQPELRVPLSINASNFTSDSNLNLGRIDIVGTGVLTDAQSRGDLLLFDALRDFDAPECAYSGSTFEWTSAPQGLVEIATVDTLTDDCLFVSLKMPGDDTSPYDMSICVPNAAFPFEVGDEVSFEGDLGHLAITQAGGDRLDVFHNRDGVVGVAGDIVPRDDCSGRRSPCRAHALSAVIAAPEGDFAPGQVLDLGADERLFLGRTEVVMTSPTTCDIDLVGTRVDYAIVTYSQEQP